MTIENLVLNYLDAMQIFCGIAFVVCGTLSIYFFLSAADYAPQLSEEIYFPMLSPLPAIEIPEKLYQYSGKKRELRLVKKATVIQRARALSKATGKPFHAYYYCAGNKWFESFEICREDKENNLRKAICLSDDSFLIRIS